MDEGKQKYCICRTTDVSTFMIGCDNCEEWYHGHCIGVTEKQSKLIKHFFCDPCQKKNASLKCVYKKTKGTKNEQEEVIKESKKTKEKKEQIKEIKKDIVITKVKKHSSDRNTTKSSPITPPPPPSKSSHNDHQTALKSSTDIIALQEQEEDEDEEEDTESDSEVSTKRCIYGLDDCGICAYCKEFGKKAKQSRNCGICEPCRRIEDCARCDHCLDMRKFGGPNKLKQKCCRRKCLNLPSKRSAANRELTPPVTIATSSPAVNHSVPVTSIKNDAPLHRKRTKGNARNKKKHKGKSTLGNKKHKNHHRTPKIIDEAVISNQQCYGPNCVEIARKTSRFCSETCGLALAKKRIMQILPQRIADWNSSPCIAKENNAKKLEKIRSDQQLAREELVDLDLKYDDLLEQISKCIGADPDDSDPDNNELETDEDLSVYCVICGNEVVQRSAIKHMDRCFAKYESQTSFGSIYKTQIEGNLMFCDYYSAQNQTYCKRLKVLCPEHSKEKTVEPDEVCGCPLVKDLFEPTGDFCLTRKRKCLKHPNWEKLRKAQIDMLRLRQWMKLDELFDKERAIMQEDAQRAGVLGLLCNQTLDHDQKDEDKLSYNQTSYGTHLTQTNGQKNSYGSQLMTEQKLEDEMNRAYNNKTYDNLSPQSSYIETYDEDCIMQDNMY